MLLTLFLSSNTQDFIEVDNSWSGRPAHGVFLSSNTQDFIEVATIVAYIVIMLVIPEL